VASIGAFGGRFVYPRKYDKAYSERLLIKTLPIKQWLNIRNMIIDGQYPQEIKHLSTIWNNANTEEVKNEILSSELNNRLNWSEYIAGNYDKNTGTFYVWLNSGIYVKIRVKNDNLISFSFEEK
jgi:ABC-type anion transport system duplicated permease subunit